MQIWLKNQSSPFSKWFLGFVHLFKWILIKLSKFLKSMNFFLYSHLLLKRWQGEPWAHGPKKPKFSKCFVWNQISGEGCICLLWVLNGIILSRNTPKSDLSMTRVDFMCFLKFRVRLIQALPNSVRWLPNSRILFLTPPNMCGKAKKRIHNPRNHILSLIFISPSTHLRDFPGKTMSFTSKFFQA